MSAGPLGTSTGLRPRLADRVGLVAAGIALLVSGVFALSRHLSGAGEPAFGAGAGRAFWYAAGATGLIAAVLGARWLYDMLAPRCRGRRTGAGTAMLGVALKGITGLRRLHVSLERGRRVRISLCCEPDADLAELRRRLDDSAAARVRRQLGDDSLPAVVRMHVR